MNWKNQTNLNKLVNKEKIKKRECLKAKKQVLKWIELSESGIKIKLTKYKKKH